MELGKAKELLIFGLKVLKNILSSILNELIELMQIDPGHMIFIDFG